MPSRVELAAVVMPSSANDPRHVRALLDNASVAGDGKGAPLRRARLRLSEWQRAGIVKRDEQPALYAVRRRHDDGREAVGLFAAISVDDAPAGGGNGAANAGAVAGEHEARLEALGVSIEPVVAAFDEKRVARTLENAIDREADAGWRLDGWSYELWCIDEESTTARITTLLSSAPLTIESGQAAWSAQASWWKASAQKRNAAASGGDDDRARAGQFALAFLHPKDAEWSEVPVGAALAPLTGALE